MYNVTINKEEKEYIDYKVSIDVDESIRLLFNVKNNKLDIISYKSASLLAEFMTNSNISFVEIESTLVLSLMQYYLNDCNNDYYFTISDFSTHNKKISCAVKINNILVCGIQYSDRTGITFIGDSKYILFFKNNRENWEIEVKNYFIYSLLQRSTNVNKN